MRTFFFISTFCMGLWCYGASPQLTQAEEMLRQSKNKEDAKQIIARYLTSNETDKAYAEVGSLYARVKDWANAVHYFEIASHRNEKNPVIWYELGVAQHQNRKTDDAVASFRKSLTLDPKNEKTYIALGEVLELSRDRYDARGIYTSAVNKVGHHPLFHSKLCWLNFQDNFQAESIKQCTLATKLDGSDTNSWALLARAYYLNQKRPQAFDVLTKMTKTFPKAGILFRVRGLIYYEEKAYEQAINDLGKAFGLDPQDDEAAIYLARSYFELGYYDRALPIYVEACDIDRDYRFEFLSKQREVSRKDEDLSAKYQQELDRF